MLNGLKNLFGGGMDPMKMLKPMLPKLMEEAEPAIISAYIEKAKQLEELAGGLRNDEDFKEEIVPFPVIRNGKLKIQWTVICHARNNEGVWSIHIGEVLQTIEMKDLLKKVSEEVNQKQLPEAVEHEDFKLLAESTPVPQEAEPVSMVEKAIDPEHLKKVSQLMKETHERYFLERYVVVKIENSFEVIEGPAPEKVQVYYGHQQEEIAQNWADNQNRS